MGVGIAARKEATIKVQRGGGGEVRLLPEGAAVNFYIAYLENRSTVPATFALSVISPAGYRAELLGPVRDINLAANANRRVDFLVKLAPVPDSQREIELHLLNNGTSVAVTAVKFSVQ